MRYPSGGTSTGNASRARRPLIVVNERVTCIGTALPSSSTTHAPSSRIHVYSTSCVVRSGHGCGLKTTTGRVSTSSCSMWMRLATDCTAELKASAASDDACPSWSRASSYAGSIAVPASVSWNWLNSTSFHARVRSSSG
jgi:hypothetical protein